MSKKKLFKLILPFLISFALILPLFHLTDRYLLIFDTKQKILFRMMQYKPIFLKNNFFEIINTLFLSLFVIFNIIFLKKILLEIGIKKTAKCILIVAAIFFMFYWVIEIAS